MKGTRNITFLTVIALVLLLTVPVSADTAPYIAFSMNKAKEQMKTNGRKTTQVERLGGITVPVAIIYDESTNDLILVGQVDRTRDNASIDDLVVAMRVVLKNGDTPMVSIERDSDTSSTKMQTVVFGKGLESTKYGESLLTCDVILKKLGLGDFDASVWGVVSYFDRSYQYWMETGVEDAVNSRFWFQPSRQSRVGVRNGVVVVERLNIDVNTQILATFKNGKPVPNEQLANINDVIGDEFATSIASCIDDLTGYYPELGKLDILFRFAGLSEGLEEMRVKFNTQIPNLDYWLDDFKVENTKTPSKYPLLVKQKEDRSKSARKKMTLDGGISFDVLVLELNDGDINAFKSIVVGTRPDDNPLIWNVPLDEWNIYDAFGTGSDKNVQGNRKNKSQYPDKIGCSISKSFNSVGSNSTPFDSMNFSPAKIPAIPHLSYNTGDITPGMSHTANVKPPSYNNRMFNLTESFSPVKFSNDVGGVMLAGNVNVKGDMSDVDLSKGNFSLIVDGKDVKLSPEGYRRFVTALWAVYFSDVDPGISIDPIAQGAEKQIVRYIGNVINTDLGRVMREADYLMKQLAVGTRTANVQGFHSVDYLMSQKGVGYFNASRRFWFVPSDMNFRVCGNTLIFENGRMELKTEYVLQNKRQSAEKSDEAFAAFFTAHYDEIAASPGCGVLKELKEYSKLVAIAQYLKQNKVPLYWFLMANKHLVITEDSPGCVEALIKKSNYFNATIEGGVDLGEYKGNYVYDKEVINQINQVVASRQNGIQPGNFNESKAYNTDLGSKEPFSFNLKEKSYSVLPQFSSSSGRDSHGNRYQTDLSIASDTTSELELVRYFKPGSTNGDFGKGWHLLIPYKISFSDNPATTKFQSCDIPLEMAIENLMTGDKEILTFDAEKYVIAGYIPRQVINSQVIGLFIKTDLSFSMIDKLGCEFDFDPSGNLTDIFMPNDNHLGISYAKSDQELFSSPPFMLESENNRTMEFLNVVIPEKMKITNLACGTTETLSFKDGEIAGYVPDNPQSTCRILAIMTDGSFQMLDTQGNEVAFDPSGRYMWMLPSVDKPVIKSVSSRNHKVDFDYSVDNTGNLLIASADVVETSGNNRQLLDIKYRYDESGRLCNIEK
jgi:hypothetical protein